MASDEKSQGQGGPGVAQCLDKARRARPDAVFVGLGR
jgi:hypothetical protein